MSDEENNEDVEQNNTIKKNKTPNQIEKLKEYVQQMAYKPVIPQPASDRTQALSKAPKKYILGTYAEHKDNFKPKERSERIERIVKSHTPMKIENLEEFIRNHRKKQAKYEKDRKEQQINYHETLKKLEKQCEDQLMNAIVHKFAKEITMGACYVSASNVQTESFQNLQNALICNMILALKVSNEQQCKDLTIYKKLATVFADLILQLLFLAHNNCDEQNYSNDITQQLPKNTERDLLIKLRALRASKKKLYFKRQRSARRCAVLAHHLDK